MLQRRGWLGGPKPPKNPHSLEHLKYLHHVLMKNQTVTESNKSLIVEALRSMAEILIWGDQNDSSVFEFYLEKNMFLFFLNILEQNSGNYVCVQLLQTLNILFENLQHETSLYYLLSNNHINEVICHKFDFSDEEVMAYYISFLKTLSLRLNQHTIHFFYNEHTDDFALYTEAIKFFNHPESMVRIAVRTLTLNVYNVNDRAMLRFIRDKTAAPYFSNLVWFIAEHVREVDNCVRNNANHQHRDRLRDLVAEHLDHLHYLNDIVTLENEMLNEVLIHHLLHRLFLPLYVRSLADGSPGDDNVYYHLILDILLKDYFSIFYNVLRYHLFLNNKCFLGQYQYIYTFIMFTMDTLLVISKDYEYSCRQVTIQCCNKTINSPHLPFLDTIYSALNCTGSDYSALFALCFLYAILHNKGLLCLTHLIENCSKIKYNHGIVTYRFVCILWCSVSTRILKKRTGNYQRKHGNLFHLTPKKCTLLNKANSAQNTLNKLILIHRDKHSFKEDIGKEEGSESYCHWLIERLLRIISKSVMSESKVRLATLRLTSILLKKVGVRDTDCVLLEEHLSSIEVNIFSILAEAMQNLQKYLKEEEMFLDIFEDEYRTLQPLNVEYLMMDSSLLLPPTVTPLTGIEFSKRLPCGQSEQARQLIGIFFTLRDLSLFLCKESETQLPLTREQDCIQTNDKLDLNNSDLIACTVSSKESKQRRFLVVELYQLILVEPDSKRLGWGVVKFAGFLQVLTRIDSRTLHVIIHKPSGLRRVPILAANFIFDDHIRCMAAKQRLTKGRMRARHLKTGRIAVLLGV
uniref:Uncharacterized protein n=1 Tax=Ciona savignyi TaxID=51511 RepID=H2Y951_CIOSA